MSQNFDTTIGLSADFSSAGQPFDFDGAFVTNLVITNNSGVGIQYTPDGTTWTTINPAGSASPAVPDSTNFYLRKLAAGGAPASVRLTWRARDSLDPSSVAITGGTQAGESVVAVAHASQLMRRPLKASVLGNSFSVAGGAGWFYEMCSNSGGLLEIDSIAGVAGNTTAQMLARVSTIPSTSQVCFVQEGTNDAGNAVTSVTHATNLLAICNALTARGIMPILVMAPPRDSFAAAIANNRFAEYQLARKSGIPIIDPFGGFFDVTAGGWASTLSPDGIHPNLTTYRDAGRAAVDQLRGFVQRQMLQPKANVWGGMTSNGLFLNSTAGLATSWNKFGSGTASIVSASGDGLLGNYQVMSASAITGATGVYQDLSLPVGAADGDEYLVRIAIKATVTSGAPVFSVFLRWSGGVTGRDDAYINNTSLATTPMASRVWQQTLTPPAGSNFAKLWMQMGDSGPAYTADLSIAEATVVNLTRSAGF